MSTRNTQFAQSIDFTNLPPAASNVGRVFRCNPLVAGQGYFYMVSDGTYRLHNVEQSPYKLYGNRVLLIGDSMTARHYYGPTATGAGTLAGSPNTDVSWPITSTTFASPAGSLCRITGATSEALNTWATIVSQVGTTITVRYGFDVTGLTAGTATVWCAALHGDTGYFNHVKALHRIEGINTDFLANQGIGGNRFDSIYGRLESDITPYLPCRVCLFSGFNDAVAVVGATKTQAQILASARQVIDYLLAIPLVTVDLISAIPFGTGAVGVSTNEAGAITLLKAINAQHQGYAAKYPDRVIYVDAWTAIKDAGSDYAATGMLSTELIHPTILGAEAIADAYVSATAGTWYRGDVSTSISNDEDYTGTGANLLTNPMFEGTGGSHSGGTWTAGDVPTGYVMTVTGGTVNSAVLSPRAKGGNDYTINWTTVGATSMVFSQDITANTGVLGSTKKASIELESLGDIANTHYINVQLEVINGGITQMVIANRHQFTYAQLQRWPKVGKRYRFETPEIEIPGTATSVKLKVYMQAGAAGTHQMIMANPCVS